MIKRCSCNPFMPKFVEVSIDELHFMRKIITLLFASASILILSSMDSVRPPETPVQWMSIEEAIEKLKTEKRKVFIDVYTDWCGWCKVMDKKTFSDPKV